MHFYKNLCTKKEEKIHIVGHTWIIFPNYRNFLPIINTTFSRLKIFLWKPVLFSIYFFLKWHSGIRSPFIILYNFQYIIKTFAKAIWKFWYLSNKIILTPLTSTPYFQVWTYIPAFSVNLYFHFPHGHMHCTSVT